MNLRRIFLSLCLSACFLPVNAAEEEDIFLLLNLDYPGLEQVKSLHALGEDAAAAESLLAYFRTRKSEGTPELPSVQGLTITASQQKMADEALEHRFFAHYGYQPSYFYGDDIDWRYWPVKDNELRWQLHRHKWFTPMGYAYQVSRNAKYAMEWALEYQDWIRKNPLVALDDKEFEITGNSALDSLQENMCYAWRPLEVSHRVQDQILQFQLFLDSPAFTPEFLLLFLKNYHRHVEFLRQHYSKEGNHLLFEAQRTLYAGAFFPEFKAASNWREGGVKILNREIERQVYPDGGQYELDPHYHLAAINVFCKALEMARLHGFGNEFPASYGSIVERMIAFYAQICYPDYSNPCFSDAKLTTKEEVLGSYRRWSTLFPENAFIRYMATEGREGELPAGCCKGFLDSGFFVFRSGWGPDATQMVVKAGPKGEWHCQPDNGTFELWHKGLRLFPDSGSYVYAGDEEVMAWRNWFRQTSSHNTVTLDDRNLAVTQSRTLLWIPDGDTPVLVTENPSYEGLTHRRSIFFVQHAFFVLVDEVYGPAHGEVGVHFHPGPNLEGQYTLVCQGPENMVYDTMGGWMSTAYRSKVSRPHLVYHAPKDTAHSLCFVSVLIPGGDTHQVSIGKVCAQKGECKLTIRADKKKYHLRYTFTN